MTRLQRSELVGFAKSQGIRADDVLLTGFVSDRDLAALYRSCALFVFSSLYEGAGLPILEAMSCGAPVVASGVSSMPELLGDAEGTLRPDRPGRHRSPCGKPWGPRTGSKRCASAHGARSRSTPGSGWRVGRSRATSAPPRSR